MPPILLQQAQRLAAMELLTLLSAAHGRCLGSSSVESMSIAARWAWKHAGRKELADPVQKRWLTLAAS
jgi:hypothetical protein